MVKCQLSQNGFVDSVQSYSNSRGCVFIGVDDHKIHIGKQRTWYTQIDFEMNKAVEHIHTTLYQLSTQAKYTNSMVLSE